LILNPWIEPQVFKHTYPTLGKNVCFLNAKKGPIQATICFKLVLGLLVFGPLSKVALICSHVAWKLLTNIWKFLYIILWFYLGALGLGWFFYWRNFTKNWN
jgi:hypothetical protein